MKDLYLKNGDLKNYPRLFEDIFHIESTLYKYEENEEIIEKDEEITETEEAKDEEEENQDSEEE